MERVIVIDKKVGETPLEAINVFKGDNPEYADVRMAYAGRLDPMAEGLLLVLVGEECKNRDEYQGMDKTYEFDVLLGVSTDTYDTLGMIDGFTDRPIGEILPLRELPVKLVEIAKNVKSINKQQYPPYSSYHVDGKPLWWWAKNGKLDEIEIPEKQISINDFKINRVYEISAEDLLNEVTERTNLVTGDFRQDETIQDWRSKLKNRDSVFPILSFEIDVTSGTYVRSIAKQIGELLGIPALAYRIRRTKVGEWEL